MIAFPASRTLFIGFSPEWGGTTRLVYTDVLVVREIHCKSWLTREYMPANNNVDCFTYWFGDPLRVCCKERKDEVE